MTDVTFKAIHECRLELVAHTVMAPKHIPHDDGLSVWYQLHYPTADFLPVSAARASFGKEDKTGEDEKADIKLMKYLADHQHMTPFEYNHATFLIECPLFIRSQIMRHRTFTFNEISRRYTSEDIGFWKPDKWRKQSKSNKQASTDEEIDPVMFPDTGIRTTDAVANREWTHEMVWKDHCKQHLCYYNTLLARGLCREQARAMLPQSLLTRFYMGGNLRNWVHFLRLRLDSHAQYEVRVVAERIAQKLRELWPVPMSVLLPEETNDHA
jgi:thymidylate synthase (FAD)